MSSVSELGKSKDRTFKHGDGASGDRTVVTLHVCEYVIWGVGGWVGGLITLVVCEGVCVAYRTCVHVSRLCMTYGRARRAHEEGQHQDRLLEVIGDKVSKLAFA